LIAFLRVFGLGSGGAHPAAGAFAVHRHQYSPKTLLYCRATFILCDIIADFLQFVASLQLGLSQNGEGGSVDTSTFMAVLTLLSMSFTVLEMHQVHSCSCSWLVDMVSMGVVHYSYSGGSFLLFL
jgi:hypothetical protein